MSRPETISADNDLQLWLRTDVCYPILYEVAKKVYSWARREKIPREILDYEENDDPVQSIVGFVWEFLNSPTRLENCRIQLEISLSSGDLRGFGTTLVTRIISYCLDERRQEKNSPFHACYRRLTRVLSERKSEVRYEYREKIGSYYAVSKESDLPYCPTGYLGASGFGGWPHPGPTNKERDKAESLLRIAQLFWNRSLEELNKVEHYLPIIDLTRYVDAIYGLQRPELLNSSSRDDADQPQDKGEESVAWQAHDPFESAAAQLPKTFDPQYKQELLNAVEKLVDSWKPPMQMSFCLKHECAWTLAEIANYLNLNSHQDVDYHLKKAQGSLKEFFLQKGELDGNDREEQEFVCESVLAFILKKHPECREQKQRSPHRHE